MTRTRIGILGGTFDPVHLGHLATALAAARTLALDRVLILPSGTPPHRPQQPTASRFHRFAMAALAISDLDPLELSDLEIGATGPSYTYDTLERVRSSSATMSQLFFITGADAFAEIETWSRYPQVLNLAHFVVVSRPGHPVERLPALLPALSSRMMPAGSALAGSAQPAILLLDAATPDVSSTDLRRRLEAGASISGLVPDAVASYIEHHGLYARAGAHHQPADHLHGQN